MAERGSIEEVGDDFLLRISGILGPLSAAAKALAQHDRLEWFRLEGALLAFLGGAK